MKMYKGFNKDMTCRGFKFEEGKTYEEEKAELCASGFHACEDPIDCFSYYAPASSTYHEVDLDNVTDEREIDTKCCGTKITVGAKIGIPGIIEAHIEYVKENVKKSVEAGDSESVTAGEKEAATAGECGAATAGNRGAATSRGSASVGEKGIASVRGNGCRVKGGLGSVLIIAEEYAYNYNIKFWKSEVVDGEKIKPDTWYRLDECGEFEEIKEG